ncbi:MAG: hypothetical protein Q7K40_05190 [bacterium]|nr:hypothetical protein [bacterium]
MPEALITFILFIFILAFLTINIIGIFQTKGSVLKVAGLIIVFALFFTGSSIFWADDATYRFDVIKPLENGWPIPFSFVDHPMKELWAPPVIVWNNFFGSAIINAILWGVGLFSLALFFRKAGIVVRPPTFKVTLIAIVTLIVVIISASFISLKILEWRNPGIYMPITPMVRHVIPTPIPSPLN